MKKLLLLLLCVPLIFSCGNQETKVEGFCVEGDCENGTGTFVYADGEKYVGEWSDGLRDGEGTLIIYSPATSDAAYLINRNEVFYHAIKFEGVWKEGKKNGIFNYSLITNDPSAKSKEVLYINGVGFDKKLDTILFEAAFLNDTLSYVYSRRNTARDYYQELFQNISRKEFQEYQKSEEYKEWKEENSWKSKIEPFSEDKE